MGICVHDMRACAQCATVVSASVCVAITALPYQETRPYPPFQPCHAKRLSSASHSVSHIQPPCCTVYILTHCLTHPSSRVLPRG